MKRVVHPWICLSVFLGDVFERQKHLSNKHWIKKNCTWTDWTWKQIAFYVTTTLHFKPANTIQALISQLQAGPKASVSHNCTISISYLTLRKLKGLLVSFNLYKYGCVTSSYNIVWEFKWSLSRRLQVVTYLCGQHFKVRLGTKQRNVSAMHWDVMC